MTFIKLDTGELLNTVMIESIGVSQVGIDPDQLKTWRNFDSEAGRHVLHFQYTGRFEILAEATMPSQRKIRIKIADIEAGSENARLLNEAWDAAVKAHPDVEKAVMYAVKDAHATLVKHSIAQEALATWLHSNK